METQQKTYIITATTLTERKINKYRISAESAADAEKRLWDEYRAVPYGPGAVCRAQDEANA